MAAQGGGVVVGLNSTQLTFLKHETERRWNSSWYCHASVCEMGGGEREATRGTWSRFSVGGAAAAAARQVVSWGGASSALAHLGNVEGGRPRRLRRLRTRLEEVHIAAASVTRCCRTMARW